MPDSPIVLRHHDLTRPRFDGAIFRSTIFLIFFGKIERSPTCGPLIYEKGLLNSKEVCRPNLARHRLTRVFWRAPNPALNLGLTVVVFPRKVFETGYHCLNFWFSVKTHWWNSYSFGNGLHFYLAFANLFLALKYQAYRVGVCEA